MVKEKENKPRTEKVPLLLVYKEDGKVKMDLSNDVNEFELWGFLKLYVEDMGERIKEDFTTESDNEKII